MAGNFYGGQFFGGGFFGAITPIVIIDTHDGGDEKRRDEAKLEAKREFRRHIEAAFDSKFQPAVADIIAPYVETPMDYAATTLPPIDYDRMFADMDRILRDIERAKLAYQAEIIYQAEMDDEEAILLLLS